MVPFPSVAVPEHAANESTIESYRSLATKIGFQPAALVAEELRAFFARNRWKVYKTFDVGRYLDDKVAKLKDRDGASLKWTWRPLRPKDAIAEGWRFTVCDGRWEEHYSFKDGWRCRPYESLVPLRVLEKVALLEEAFAGGQIKFFVSHYQDKHPDPFIVVRTAGPEDAGDGCFIFDVWDEPGFEG